MSLPVQVLAKKMIAIMELSQQQLSKQDHYDYGLRSFVIPIARAAGQNWLCCTVHHVKASCLLLLQTLAKHLVANLFQPHAPVLPR